MAPDKGDFYGGIERFLIWEIEVMQKPFGVDVFRTEEEELPFVYDMGHVIIGTISPVADKNNLYARRGLIAVCHVAESAEFIFFYGPAG